MGKGRGTALDGIHRGLRVMHTWSTNLALLTLGVS